jgi:hypothetical protein
VADVGSITNVQPEPLRAFLAREIETGETISWCGQPGAAARGPKIWFVCFWGLTLGIIGAATLHGAFAVLQNGRHDRWPLAGLIILPTLIGAVGVTLVWGAAGILRRPHQFAGKAYAAVYAMTDRRLLVIQGSGGGGYRCATISWPDVIRLKRHEDHDGRGDLVFELTHGGMETLRNLPNIRDVERAARERLPARP